MSALRRPSCLTPHEYLRAEREAAFKSDYLNGIVVEAMAGARYRHNLVAGNTFSEIHSALRDRPCVAFGSDMKVRIEKANVFRYPDVSAVCGPIDFFDEVEDAYGNPQLICEVLSPSTRSLDRHEKFAEYRLIDTFSEYLLIEPDRMEAELHRKDGEGRWTCDTYTEPDQAIVLESIGITFRVGDLYEKVEFPPPGT